jgi:hypothetical protein
MDFLEILDHVVDLLRRQGRLTYRTLKRQFNLDDKALEDLKIELIEGQPLAIDEQGTVLIWGGEAGDTPASTRPAPSPTPQEGQPAQTESSPAPSPAAKCRQLTVCSATW